MEYNYDIERIAEGIYTGIVNLYTLPVDLYRYTASKLQKSVFKGYGINLENATFLSDDWFLLSRFHENINVFSGAKTFQQINDSINFILDENGNIRPFNDYLRDVKKIDAVYNETWLKVERDTAISQAQSAREWQRIEGNKDLIPYLIYRTQKDERVRDSHKALEGFTAKVDDPIWGSIYPPNDWNDRCFVEQVENADITTNEEINTRVLEYNKAQKEGNKIKSLRDVPAKLFKMNSAKDGIIFKTEGIGSHPYMKVDKAYEVVKNNNFNLDMSFIVR